MAPARRIDRDRLRALRAEEDARFLKRIPKSLAMLAEAKAAMPSGVPMAWMASDYRHPPLFVESGAGGGFTDVDGNHYLDMNHADLSMTCGYGDPRMVAAVAAQMGKGSQFLLPGGDAIAVARALAARYPLPFWQFTLSASSANAEAIRLARLATGRPGLLVFAGGYHGHLAATLVTESGGPAGQARADGLGLPADGARDTRIARFNDIDAVRTLLEPGDIACVLTEPALTNCGLVLPRPGFLDALAEACRAAGTLLILDETHTQTFAFGGLTRAWALTPDMITLGKSLGGGVALGAYGMTGPLAALMERHLDVDIAERPGLAVGGTLYANALSLAAARVALTELMTEPAFARLDDLGRRLAAGLERAVAGLPWCIQRLSGRVGLHGAPESPACGQAARRGLDFELIDARRVFMANRGIWDAIATAGPAASFAHDGDDMDRYGAVFASFIAAVTTG